MHINILQHVPFEKPGIITDWASKNNYNLTYTKLYEDYTMPDIDNIDLLVVMGGPMSFDEFDIYHWLKEEIEFIKKAIKTNKAILGICLGAQLIVQALNGNPLHGKYKEIGWFPVKFDKLELTKIGWDFFPVELDVFHWHGDTFEIPKDAVHIAKSNAFQNQAFIFKDRIIGLQFHLEVKIDSILELVNNCREEIIKDKYIQSEYDILNNRKNIAANNNLMIKILERLKDNVN